MKIFILYKNEPMGKRFEVKKLLPNELFVCLGDKAQLNLNLGIWPLPSICWEVSRDKGCTWKVISTDEECLLFTPRRKDSGNLYRATINTRCECIMTNETKLIIGFLDPLQNPQDVMFMNGQTAIFTSLAEGIPEPKIQWQVSTDLGITWNNLPGETSSTLRVVMNSDNACFRDRARFRNKCGQVISKSAAIVALLSANGAGGNIADLTILDPNDGSVLRTIGNIGFSVTGLAISPITGKMFGVTTPNDPNFPSHLIEINFKTGQGTVIGPFVNVEVISDITFRSDGILYGWANVTVDDLVTINTSTGEATVVGNSGLGTGGTGLTFIPNGKLYVYGITVVGSGLQQINPDLGTPIPPLILISEQAGGAMTSNSNNLLYAITRQNEGLGPDDPRFLTTIDPITGSTNVLGSVPLRTDALTFCYIFNPRLKISLLN